MYLRSHAIHLALFSCLSGKHIRSPLSHRIESPRPPCVFLSPESMHRFSASSLLITVLFFGSVSNNQNIHLVFEDGYVFYCYFPQLFGGEI